MDWRRLPPLNALRAFALVAETGSQTRAAERLNVTQAAISQQVRLLERHLGVALLRRSGRGTALTEEGAALAYDLVAGFSRIGSAVERLGNEAKARPVQITTSPAFAVEWLLPRIAEFQQAHPDIALMLNPTGRVMPIVPGGPDVAVRYQDRRRPAEGLRKLLVTDMVVIAAPELIAGRDVSTPAALAAFPWLQELGTNEAAEWMTLHGVVPARPLGVTQMPGNLIMSAVRRGDGLTYTARAFFRDDIAAGRMVVLFSEPLFGIYHVETGPEPLRPAVRRFLDWLCSHAETVTAGSAAT